MCSSHNKNVIVIKSIAIQKNSANSNITGRELESFMTFFIIVFYGYGIQLQMGSVGSQLVLSQSNVCVIKYLLYSSTEAIQAFLRDGYHCLIASLFNLSSGMVARWHPSWEEIIKARGTCFTQCTHIIPQSTILM